MLSKIIPTVHILIRKLCHWPIILIVWMSREIWGHFDHFFVWMRRLRKNCKYANVELQSFLTHVIKENWDLLIFIGNNRTSYKLFMPNKEKSLYCFQFARKIFESSYFALQHLHITILHPRLDQLLFRTEYPQCSKLEHISRLFHVCVESTRKWLGYRLSEVSHSHTEKSAHFRDIACAVGDLTQKNNSYISFPYVIPSLYALSYFDQANNFLFLYNYVNCL